jgi:hypothetical protein
MRNIGTNERGLALVAASSLVANWLPPMMRTLDFPSLTGATILVLGWGAVGWWFLSSALADGKRRALEGFARELAERVGGVVSESTVIDEIRNAHRSDLYPGWQQDVGRVVRRVGRETRAADQAAAASR